MANLLAAIGGLVGFAMGGPAGAALGAGIGSAGSGSSLDNILKDAGMAFGMGSIPAVAGVANSLAGKAGLGSFIGPQATAAAGGTFGGNLTAGAQQALQTASGASVGAKNALTGAAGAKTAAPGILGGLTDQLGFSPGQFLLASAIQAGEPKPTPMTEAQKYSARTGETTDYQGTATPYARNINRGLPTLMAAQGGFIEGPGTGKSDSIPAMIYQNGGPVQEAALSDGEFVMTADAVKGAGGGNRAKGAAEMYKMMNQYERRA